MAIPRGKPGSSGRQRRLPPRSVRRQDVQAESDLLRTNWGDDFYAAQTWSDIPETDGRRLQIGWLRNGQYPGMPFNQQMSFPYEMTVRTTEQGPRLFLNPIREVEKLHRKKHEWSNLSLKPGQNPLANLTGDLFEIRMTLEYRLATSLLL
jgi:sucrose-6-phosphate hydrolase SacC (GH32 family)